MPYDDVMAMWYDTITEAYTPQALLSRFEHQTKTHLPATASASGRSRAAA